MKNESMYPKLLKILASVLEKLTDEEMDALLAGERKLVTEAKAKRKETKMKPKPVSAEINESFLKSLAEQLSSCNSRDEGVKILTALKLKKADLLQITEEFGIKDARKNDTVKILRGAVIEHFIGFKIDNDAIKTIDLRSSREKL